METINIVGINCRVDKLSKLNYETLFKQALHSLKYKNTLNAAEIIDRELRDNGFKPTHKVTEQVTADNNSEGNKVVRARDSNKQRRNRKPSKE